VARPRPGAPVAVDREGGQDQHRGVTDVDASQENQAAPKIETKLDRSRDVSRLSRHSYLAGFAGTIAVLGMGYLASRRKVLTEGWKLPWGLSDGPQDVALSMAFVLLVVSIVMFAVELAIRLDVDRGKIIKLAPDIKEGRYGPFLLKCLLVYIVEIGIISVAIGFYKTANEYGYLSNNANGYYHPWFAVLETFLKIYLFGAPLYIIATRALQHAPSSDRKQAAFTVLKLVRLGWAKITRDEDADIAPFDRYDKSALLGLGVKVFFVPLMTVFFSDQFTHLVKNFDYLRGDNITFGVKDFHNVSYTIVFSVDVGLAWAGYVVTSRWIKNTLFSTEPTWEGWSVALLCYPPINRVMGNYYSTPNESGFFQIPNPQVVMFLAICSALSFTVYTSATVMFGLRFSNLTHRGIITTGPYALIRHPAYASKNFSWWCVMFPYVLYEIWTTKSPMPLLQVVGMVIMTALYYRRAITEEEHLSRDPEYRIYMKKVPYRYIPGVF
jgi:protein-S-isoprenylcysteine O-methyltransferase Ste14